MNVAAGERAKKTKTKSEKNDDHCFRRRHYRHHPLLEYARGRKKRLGDAHFHHFHHFPFGEEIGGILAPVRDIRDRCKRDHGEIRRGDVFELLFIFCYFFFFALLLLLFCCSQEGGKRREDEEDGFRGELDCFLGANFCQEKEKEKKKRRKSSDVIVILSNNNDEKTGNGDTTLRRRRSASQNTTIEILSSLETDSQKKRLRVDDSDDDDDAKAFWNRRILTTPPMSPINKTPGAFFFKRQHSGESERIEIECSR